MLSPRKVKFRKSHRGRMTGKSHRGNKVQFGAFGLQSMEPHWITSRQIEAARIAMTRYIKRGGKVWIRIFPDKPVTKKAAETRMGGGKGAVDEWVSVVQPGRVLFELGGVERRFLSMPWRGCEREYFIWGATAAMLRNFYRLLVA